MSTVRSTSVKREMQCKVCMDAGKPKELYSSHWVKDANGKVICPTLLSVKCPKCLKMGHTVKFCTAKEVYKTPTKVIKEEKKELVVENKNIFERLSYQPVSNKQTTNLKKIVDDFPALSSCNITLRAHQKHFANEEASTPSYSDILNKLREAKAASENEAANKAASKLFIEEVVEKPYLNKDITLRGSGNITFRDHQKHYTISEEEEKEFCPFFGIEKEREIRKYNHDCFLGKNGLCWNDVLDSDATEEVFSGWNQPPIEDEEEEEEEEEFEEEDYDW